MQAMKSSRPASGAEHQFSHLWDMQHHTHGGRAPSHGLKVGIGTLAVTALYEMLLEQPLEELDVDRCGAEWPTEETWIQRATELFSAGELRDVALREIRAKSDSANRVRTQLELLRDKWPQLRERLRRQLIPSETLASMLAQAGAAIQPEQIGISRARLRDSFCQAFFIRRRFTVLDVAVRTRLIEPLLQQLFGPGERWEIQPV
jgi:glycerol-1-phosphate dehydrogenase [NAD(P)+]